MRHITVKHMLDECVMSSLLPFLLFSLSHSPTLNSRFDRPIYRKLKKMRAIPKPYYHYYFSLDFLRNSTNLNMWNTALFFQHK